MIGTSLGWVPGSTGRLREAMMSIRGSGRAPCDSFSESVPCTSSLLLVLMGCSEDPIWPVTARGLFFAVWGQLSWEPLSWRLQGVLPAPWGSSWQGSRSTVA